MPLAGRQMTKRETAKLMYEAGWTDAINLPKMIAVAYAESNLYTEAWHRNDNDTTDWGYLQLNDNGATGADLEAFKKMAFEPFAATAHARIMFVERRFQPWVAYNSGAWKPFFGPACTGVENMIREKYALPLA